MIRILAARVGAFGRIALVLLFGSMVPGCHGSPSCQPQGQACDPTHLCCGDDLCTNGQCVAPAVTCEPAGNPCSSTSSCCAGLTCTNNACVVPVMPPTCATAGQFCKGTSACCTGLSCLRYSPKCEKGDIGDPCRDATDCRSGLDCQGWCTRACASDAACATVTDSPKGVNSCVESTSGFICFPFCTSTPECSIYGAGATCAPGNWVSGGTITTCGS
jgi:hypothetical protein